MELIDAICCISGSGDFLTKIQAGGRQSLSGIVSRGDSAGLFDWMMDTFSYQGVSNAVAEGYLRTHGGVTWRDIEKALRDRPTCPKLVSYWNYVDCRYDKTSGCCAEPEYREGCPVPNAPLRNGRLNQTAFSFYFFVRDIAAGNLIQWIDGQIDMNTGMPHHNDRAATLLVEAMRNIFGVSDKVVAMTLSEVLMAAPKAKPHWFSIGSQMIAIDTLVHNLLHRLGILDGVGCRHAFGSACYKAGHCADIVRYASSRIDARRFNPTFPTDFPRFVQNALWRFCAADGSNVCNGNRIDDAAPCRNVHCALYARCGRIPLRTSIRHRHPRDI